MWWGQQGGGFVLGMGACQCCKGISPMLFVDHMVATSRTYSSGRGDLGVTLAWEKMRLGNLVVSTSSSCGTNWDPRVLTQFLDAGGWDRDSGLSRKVVLVGNSGVSKHAQNSQLKRTSGWFLISFAQTTRRLERQPLCYASSMMCGTRGITRAPLADHTLPKRLSSTTHPLRFKYGIL